MVAYKVASYALCQKLNAANGGTRTEWRLHLAIGTADACGREFVTWTTEDERIYWLQCILPSLSGGGGVSVVMKQGKLPGLEHLQEKGDGRGGHHTPLRI